MRKPHTPRHPGSAGRFVCIALLALCASAHATTYTCTTSSQLTSALSSVNPGDTIILSGTITSSTTYVTSRAGAASAPITIQGDGTAVLSGASNYGFEVVNDYYRLSNFVIQNASKGLVVDNANHGAVDHVHVMDIKQEGFKVRNQSKYWIFTYCSARRTGKSGDYGEGFYVGQASSNWINNTPDACAYITFFNCYATDTVNDGWDCKEGAHDIKIVNCTGDYSGSIEPAAGASHGSAGFYLRADHIQVIKCNVIGLDNGTWACRYSNTTVNGVDYGSSGNEMKQSEVTGGNVGLIYSESGTNGRVYTDCLPGPGGFYASGSATVATPAPSTFAEDTWNAEGGGTYSTLDANIGADGDPMNVSAVAAPTFSPGAGTYTSAQNVAIASGTSGATIRYTTDGSTPTETHGTIYSGPVTIAATTTLEAMAYETGYTDSNVSSATYTINGAGGGTIIGVADGFYDTPMSQSRGGTFTATVDATPSLSPSNTTVALCLGNQSSYTGLACIVRFNPSGNIDARNGSAYAADNAIPFAAGVTYHLRFEVNVSTHTYSVYVRPSGGSEQAVGLNYGFRSEQNTVTSLDTWNVDVNSSPGGSVTIGNLTDSTQSASPASAPVFSPAGGTYSSAQSVTISTSTTGASIRYTTDGSTPTETHGTLYSAPISISTTTTLEAIAYAAGYTDSAVTSATYTINGSGGGSSQNLVVTASSDDAKERTDTTSGSMNLSSSLPFGNAGSVYTVGVRFTGLNVPAGATITRAYLQFTSHSSSSTATTLTIRAQKSTNAAAFTTNAHDITTRPLTSASSTWSPGAWGSRGEAGAAEQTADLSAVVQEVVGQSGWTAGAPIVFTLAGTGDRTAQAYDNDPTQTAILHVEWQ